MGNKITSINVAIIGAGNMGKALITGLKRAYGDGIRIAVWDNFPGALVDMGDFAESIDPRNWETADFAPNAVILAVKPADIAGLLDGISPMIQERGYDFLTISVAAGISISTIRGKIGKTMRVCRAMPNTPALIGEGMSVYALSENCAPNDISLAEQIFGACGKTVNIPESLMDAATGLSGSGPAFAYSFIEALAEGGVSAGLPYQTALDTAVQTVIGAAGMIRSTGEHPSVLRSRVMSPGGTTVKGLEALERGAFKNAVMSAVTEAAAQSAKMCT
ncbi:MAG: pyrroline-5-carboxylate reductase [Chitinispirillales bacterium]|jgi:pyrroline-5-carboxylate reductase|nr:pyrroline-5-carboxylate reductase [Chitinispirillales bacterium]